MYDDDGDDNDDDLGFQWSDNGFFEKPTYDFL